MVLRGHLFQWVSTRYIARELDHIRVAVRILELFLPQLGRYFRVHHDRNRPEWRQGERDR